LADIRIERKQKNIMRSQLEEVLKMQKDIAEKIENFDQETEVAEYKKFWQELRQTNAQTIQKVSNYMVRKCNR